MTRPAAKETSAITTGPSRADAERQLFADLDRDMRAWGAGALHVTPMLSEPDALTRRLLLGSSVATT